MTTRARSIVFWPALLLLGCDGGESGTALHGDATAVVGPGTPDAMRPFERMVDGEWHMGDVQIDTWTWGPARQSIRMQTRGVDGGGNPWSDLTVYYRHPAHEKVRLFGQHPDIPGLGRGVREGTFEPKGDFGETTYDLHQPGNPFRSVRALSTRWTFDGPDAMREQLLENSGTGYEELAAWDFVRKAERTAPPPLEGDPKPSKNLAALVPLLDRIREARGSWAGTPIRLRSSFTWVPYLDMIHGHVATVDGEGTATHVLDAYLYHHVGTDELRCLALSWWAGVYEGAIRVDDDGVLVFVLGGLEGEDRVSYVTRLTSLPGGDLHSVLRKSDRKVAHFDARHAPVSRHKERSSDPSPDR